MTIRIYNSLGRVKEKFEPIDPGKVHMYVCGPTAYDSCHIGHARSVVVFDVIARYLRARDFQVIYVRNFTDVDDKIINRANQLGIEPAELAEKYIQEFYEDMDALHVERADFEPRATEFIDHMIKVVGILIDKDMAYQINGDVYFAVEKFKEYGKLSGRRLEDMEAGARVEIDEKKHNPFDFALWKSSKPGEPAWDSPWGPGRPGWHIECSAMSTEYLGQTFDIHGGGKDLIFPHHENEIAQSEAAFGKSFAKYWVHNGFVNIDQEKMSKSLGNFLIIKDVLKQYHPESIRLFLLSKHYRSPVDFSDRALKEADAALDKIYALLERTEKRAPELPEAGASGGYWDRFCQAMDDDFNTARGLGILFNAVRRLNRLLDENNDPISSDLKQKVRSGCADLYKMGHILGILNEAPQGYFEKKQQQTLQRQSVNPAKIDQMVTDRFEARKAKDWERADQIRAALSEMNVILEDHPDGTIWKIKG
jgi:cysteinyl-tRNA synthetase